MPNMLLLAATMSLLGMAKACNGQSIVAQACVCPAVYSPVCGSDGKTYPSGCQANCKGKSYRCDGPCPCSGGSGNSGIIFGNSGGASNRDSGVLSNPCNCCTKSPPPICNRLADFDCDNCLADNQNVLSCVCPDLYSPVCGNNGRTYSSSCEANCKGESLRCNGTCPCKECDCPEVYSPVCGNNGRTYTSRCEATCKGESVRCNGTCPCKECICPEMYSPVCGTDSSTYSNDCRAECNGISVKCKGQCPCSDGFVNSGPDSGGGEGSNQEGPKKPSRFNPCQCCPSNRPKFCARLADLECNNCERGSYRNYSGLPSDPCVCCRPSICDRLADYDCDNCRQNLTPILFPQK